MDSRTVIKDEKMSLNPKEIKEQRESDMDEYPSFLLPPFCPPSSHRTNVSVLVYSLVPAGGTQDEEEEEDEKRDLIS